MDHIIEGIDKDNVEATIGWMQFLSGQNLDVFNFAEWLQVSFISSQLKKVYKILSILYIPYYTVYYKR